MTHCRSITSRSDPFRTVTRVRARASVTRSATIRYKIYRPGTPWRIHASCVHQRRLHASKLKRQWLIDAIEHLGYSFSQCNRHFVDSTEPPVGEWPWRGIFSARRRPSGVTLVVRLGGAVWGPSNRQLRVVCTARKRFPMAGVVIASSANLAAARSPIERASAVRVRLTILHRRQARNRRQHPLPKTSRYKG